ncbi:MAG TPA: 5'/3'-nucleotidase SurE [Clostridiales bacterium]|nr:5'/3'-nucleotidase SurE [Clostridiales bacterium]
MKILLTNDDGIMSEGLRTLAKNISNLGDVIVVAPNSEKSAIGHAITINNPLKIRRIHLDCNEKEAYAIEGTPVDCVKFGVNVILNNTKPDILISGINNGINLGTDVIYSGTVSAAIEGTILGIKSIALSAGNSNDSGLEAAAKFAAHMSSILHQKEMPYGTLLNVNVPALPENKIKGIKVANLGVKKYADKYIKRKDPRGNDYYWLSGDILEEDDCVNCDIRAFKEGYITITPLHYDLTRYDMIQEIEKWNFTFS